MNNNIQGRIIILFIIVIFLIPDIGCRNQEEHNPLEDKDNTLLMLDEGYFIYNSKVYQLFNGEIKVVLNLKDSIPFHYPNVSYENPWEDYGKIFRGSNISVSERYKEIPISMSSIYFGKNMFYDFSLYSTTSLPFTNKHSFLIEFSPSRYELRMTTLDDSISGRYTSSWNFALAKDIFHSQELTLQINQYKHYNKNWQKVYEYQYHGKIEIDLETYLFIKDYRVSLRFMNP
ncbi:hypothetical protein ACFLS7_04940 [Bacteroidota bacterium]